MDAMAITDDLIRAIAFARDGKWDDAHAIAQRHDGDRRADWLHAVLHSIEGDSSNAAYWYRRAGREGWLPSDPFAELHILARTLAKARD